MFIKKLIKKILPNILLDKIQIIRLQRKQRILQNIFNTNFDKYCLLVYITSPFIQGVDDTHQNKWQVLEIARIIEKHFYNVDVVDYNEITINPSHKYDLVIDIYPISNRMYEEFLNPDCVRVAYFTGGSPRFNNFEEEKRRMSLFERRGVLLSTERISEELSTDISDYDACWFIGNMYNWKTYSSYNLPKVFFIPNTGMELEINPKKRKKNNFLFFASSGQIHKGLDLLLEVFSRVKECNLFICSNVKNEKKFCEVYHHELSEFDNIKTIGFVDVRGKTFKEIAEKCTYMIVPSCSEARMGSALTCMSTGMIPVLTPACGYDADECVFIHDISIEALITLVRDLANRNDAWITEYSQRVLGIVKTRYNKDNFSQAVDNALSVILQ